MANLVSKGQKIYWTATGETSYCRGQRGDTYILSSGKTVSYQEINWVNYMVNSGKAIIKN